MKDCTVCHIYGRAVDKSEPLRAIDTPYTWQDKTLFKRSARKNMLPMHLAFMHRFGKKAHVSLHSKLRLMY